ncbi:hypothetical protein L6164_026473 [Bauhinia variegata]|uniref:Uncharacterized protein n=1 Tax=Bauhinia variegata TaxID=167791 RepID=A0ACB9LQ87_BAUVA|nr:hypothetical protein L6164_026473 [Bauhinia variegata]
MELESVRHFLKGKTILVTGATGFLGKIFVEKVLRVQPDIKKLYLILRASIPSSIAERMHNEIIGKDLFRVLRDELGDNFGSFISEKVIAVAGDVSLENLGIKDANLRKDMLEEIDVVLHSAASTKFDERFDTAMRTNTIGALNVLYFAKNCTKVVILLHVSTAYVCGESEGLILEELFQMGKSLNGFSKLDIDFEMKLVENKLNELKTQNSKEETITSVMRSFGLERAKKHGWPNTYVFTKAMAEMLVEHKKENLPVIILRPSIVTSTYKEPFPGWIEGVRTVDSIAIAYCKRKLSCFPGNSKVVIDVIPADMVVNAIIVAMVANASKCSNNIYHVRSSMRNPIKYMNIADYGYKYFTEMPWMDKNRKSVKGFKLLNKICCQHFQKRYLEFNRKVRAAMRLVDLYGPYLFFNGVFDDSNMEKLEMAAKQGGVAMDLFYFDPKMIDWKDYFIKVHFPSISKHLIK